MKTNQILYLFYNKERVIMTKWVLKRNENYMELKTWRPKIIKLFNDNYMELVIFYSENNKEAHINDWIFFVFRTKDMINWICFFE